MEPKFPRQKSEAAPTAHSRFESAAREAWAERHFTFDRRRPASRHGFRLSGPKKRLSECRPLQKAEI